MILGENLGKLKENLENLDINELMQMAKEMDWTALASLSRRSELEELKRSLNEDDLLETLKLLKGMDLDRLIESSKSSGREELTELLKGLDLKKGMVALGLILLARRGLKQLGGGAKKEEVEPEKTRSGETHIEIKTKADVDSNDEIIGSKGSDKYHRSDCHLAKRISPENRVVFSDVMEAESQGYKPCALCKPS
jgi:hypothetical protein